LQFALVDGDREHSPMRVPLAIVHAPPQHSSFVVHASPL
jgi:hypothetical protein